MTNLRKFFQEHARSPATIIANRVLHKIIQLDVDSKNMPRGEHAATNYNIKDRTRIAHTLSDAIQFHYKDITNRPAAEQEAILSSLAKHLHENICKNATSTYEIERVHKHRTGGKTVTFNTETGKGIHADCKRVEERNNDCSSKSYQLNFPKSFTSLQLLKMSIEQHKQYGEEMKEWSQIKL